MFQGAESRKRWIAVAGIMLGAVACAPAVRGGMGTPGPSSCVLDERRWERAGTGRTGEVRVALVVDPATRSGWDVYGAGRLRESLAAWNSTVLPFRLVPTAHWLDADIRIVVMGRLPADSLVDGAMARYRAGFTKLEHNAQGGIARAHVGIAEAAPGAEPYTVPEQVGTLLHELGHALGLPHVDDPMALMAPRPRVEALTPSDLRLVRLRYQPGCRSQSGAIAMRGGAGPGR